MRPDVIEQMRAQIDEQAATIRALRAVLNDVETIPAEWGLSHREKQIFLLLVRRERQSAQSLFDAIYATAGREDVLPEVIWSHVSKMRAKLRRIGIEVEAKRHEGYRLLGRARFQHLLKATS